MKKALKLATLLAALALPLALAQGASAALTPAGTVITNQATLDYKVGGYSQNAVPSTATTFNVDRKVNFTVNYVPGKFVDVFPGAQNQVLTYTVTNLGNDVQDFDLAVTQMNGGSVLLGTDNIDATNMRVFRDNGATPGVYDTGDTDITAGHLLDEVAADQTVTVFVVGNFDVPQVNANIAGVSVTAVALHGHTPGAGAAIAGGAVTDTNGAVGGNAIYTVFADVADTLPNRELVLGAYRIAAPVLNVTKGHLVIWDPVNFNNTPRSIPGSFVQYAITISNDVKAIASANLTTIQDVLSGNTTLDPNFIGNALDTAVPVATSGNGLSFKVTHISGRTLVSPSYYANGSGVTVAGQSITADFAALLPAEAGSYSAGELKPGESVTVTFNVSIN
jgi:hypothetical protein